MKISHIDPLWCIVEDYYDIKNNKKYEGIFAQGNGYMSTRGCLEEGFSILGKESKLRPAANVTSEEPVEIDSQKGTYVPGVTGIHPNVNEEMVNLPWFLEFKLKFNNENLDMNNCNIEDYRRWLDLRDGTINRDFIWNTIDGPKIRVNFSRFLDMDKKSLSVQQVHIKVLSGNGQLKIEAGIDGNITTNGFNHFKKLDVYDIDNKFIAMEVITDNGNKVVEIASVNSNKEINWDIEKKENHIFYTSKLDIKSGDDFIVNKYVTVTTDRDLGVNNSPVQRGLKIINNIEVEDFINIYNRHSNIWMSKWNDSDIVITGDDKAQLATRFSIYHLIRSNIEDDPRVAICAKGYAGEAYFGRYFWDTEIYMLPFFIYTNPKAARNMLMFRYNTLNGARKNAERYGYKGARYAWESSINGDEQCHLWQFADNEVHVTADIVYAIWHYYSATEDYEFMTNYGIEIMIETSRYWVTRVDKNKKGEYDLIGVMGPDEYSPFTMNSAFTNRMVKFNLEKTIEFLTLLKENDEEKFIDVFYKLNIKDEEIKQFKEVSENIKIPYDEDKKLILQSEDFERFADIDINEIWKDRSRHFIHFISQEKMYRSKCIKQADVLALMTLFPNEFSYEEIKNAYEYYEPITTHDSSLSPSTHGIIASWIGKNDEAQKYFNKASNIDLTLEGYGAAEGIHIANCGGLWQLIVFGFAGIKDLISKDKIKVKPNLPSKWKKLSFNITWKNIKYRIDIEGNKYSVVKKG